MGPLARSVDDLELAFDLTVGLDEQRGSGLRLELPASRVDSLKHLRVGLWLGDDYCPVDREILLGIEQAARTLEVMGACVEEARPSFSLAEHHETYLMHLSPIIASGFGPREMNLMQQIAGASEPEDKSPSTLQARGALLAHREWLVWNEIRAHVGDQWRSFFDDYDVLICPVTPTTAMPHDQETSYGARKIWVNGDARPYSDNVVWAGVATLCGLPSTAVPVGRHSDGLPFGLQIIGPEYADRTTMAVARWLEEAGHITTLAEGYQ
jgi:amidase